MQEVMQPPSACAVVVTFALTSRDVHTSIGMVSASASLLAAVL
jgi:hypothetical protein